MVDWLQANISTGDLALIWLAMGCGAAVQGSVGYGMALIASPVLILIDPRLIPGPFMIGAMVLSLLATRREWHSIDFNGVKWAVVGRIPAMAVAGFLLVVLSSHALILLFGGFVLFAILISVLGVRFPPRPLTLIIAGLLSGVMGTIAAIGGPPMALVYQNEEPDQLRSTLAGYGILGGVFSMVTLLIVGKLGITELWLSATIVPGVLLGYWVSSRLITILNKDRVRVAVLAVGAISASIVIIQELLSPTL